MLTPLTQKASTLHLFWDSALKKQILAYFWDWHCFVLLRVLKLWPEFSTKFFESWNDEYSQDGTGLKVSKHLFVMQPLTSLPLAHVPYFTPLLLYLPLHAPDSNAPSRDACTDGPAAACSPSGSSWHGRPFLARCLCHHPQSLQESKNKCTGVQAECRGTQTEPNWLLSCTATSWHSWQ